MNDQPSKSKCCFCIDLRTGVIVISVLQILGAIGVLGYGIFLGTIVGMIGLINLVGLLAGVTLLIGAIKYNTTAVIIHIVLAVIEIINIGVIAFGVLHIHFGLGLIFGNLQRY